MNFAKFIFCRIKSEIYRRLKDSIIIFQKSHKMADIPNQKLEELGDNFDSIVSSITGSCVEDTFLDRVNTLLSNSTGEFIYSLNAQDIETFNVDEFTII